MTSPNESSVLAWSKTIDGVRFRAFAFTQGCGRPDCEACNSMEANGPVWACFMNPRPLEAEAYGDEWCLCLLAWGPNELVEHFEEAVADMHMAEEHQQEFWRKVVALIGVRWGELVERPYEFAVKHKSALDECMDNDGLVGQLIKKATPEQLREVREAKRTGDGGEFGRAFGKLFWDLVQAHRSKRSGS